MKSQICDDVIRRPASGNRRSLNAVLPNMSSSMNVKGDMEKGMETMESMTGGSARVDMWPPGEEHSFDDSEEWAKIEGVVIGYGGYGFNDHGVTHLFQAGKTKIQSVGEWLEDMSLGQYENTLVANGYDDMDFLGGNIIEDQDLQEIGIKDEKHRRQIIEAAKSLPKVKPISADNMPSSVEEWLRSLHLIEYYDTFISHKYDRMERVQHLWEVELSTVLDIGTIGYRKRLLASLGEKQVPEMTNRNSRSFVPRTEDSTSYYSDIDLFKDYTNLRPSAMMGEEQRKLMPMAGGQSAFLSTQFNGRDTDEVRREGKHIQDESVHIRPPHLAQSTSPVKQWCHKPEVLIKGCCNYIAQYLGSAVVRQLNGTDSTREGIAKMKKSTENTARIPSITLSISYKGVKFIDADSRRVVCEHEIGNIFCACQDSEHLNFFAYITKDKELDKHYCHVFCVRSTDLARNIILTLGQAFEIAYQMALKEKAEEEALEFERKLSLGKDDYAHGSSASHGPQSFA